MTVSKNFQPLSSGEVLSINSESRFVIGHSTFRVDEFTAALKQLLLEQGLGGITEATIDWLTDEGIECDVLRFGASGWVKGKVRLHLEFAEETSGEASTDPKPKAAAEVLPSVAADSFPSVMSAPISDIDQGSLDDLELEFNEAEFADLSLELDDVEAEPSGLELPDLEPPQPETPKVTDEFFDELEAFDDLDLASSSSPETAQQDSLNDFESLFTEPETEQQEAEAPPEMTSDFVDQEDDLEELFGEEDADFDVLVAADPEPVAQEEIDVAAFDQAADLDDFFGEAESFVDAAPETPPEQTNLESPETPVAFKMPGKETIVSHDTLVQPDEESLENLFGTGDAPEATNPDSLDLDLELGETEAAADLEALFGEGEEEAHGEDEEAAAAIAPDGLEELFGDADDDFDVDLFETPEADLELAESALALDLEEDLEEFTDDEPTAITMEDFNSETGDLGDLFAAVEMPSATEEEEIFQSLLEDDTDTALDDELADLDADVTTENPFAETDEASTVLDGAAVDEEEEADPFALFADNTEDSLDDSDEDLDLAFEDLGNDVFGEDDQALDDLFDEAEESSGGNRAPQTADEGDLGEFINVAMFRKKP
ncbi:hypothetical protein FLX56_15550 [Synechococcus moorigangaii CMS01]|nr:hypothetical protein [Synechococcus moorigangaii CMS01]